MKLFSRRLPALLGVAALAVSVAAATGYTSNATVITLKGLRLNINGLIQVDATLTQSPPPVGGVIDVAFEYSDGTSTVTETVRSSVGSVNLARAVTSRQPFPCDKSYEVTATLKNPGTAGVYTKAVLTRKCTRTQGTPDLQAVSAVRADGGGLQSPRETPIRVRIKLKNAGQNMPFNEMGGTPWTVQVTPGTGVSADGGTGGLQTFRIALQAAQEISMDVMPVALPCGKESQIEVRIDRENVILESNKTNNRAVFMIAGNRCQDA